MGFSKTEYGKRPPKWEWTPFRTILIYVSVGLLFSAVEQIFFIQDYLYSYRRVVSFALQLLYIVGGGTFLYWCFKKAGQQAHKESERESQVLLRASEQLVIVGQQAHEENERKSRELLRASEQLVIAGQQAHEESEKKSYELLQASEKLAIAGQMAAGIAHEIRNPLTALKGFLKLMRNGSEGKKEYFDIMDSELDRIELILSELLLLSKPQQNMALQRKELLNLLHQVVVLLETQASLNNVQLMTRSLSDQLYINASENHMKQVFINIIKNAIEAMPSGGEITVEVEQTDSQVIVSITDQGFGIPEEHLTKIGEPFYSTKQTGTGLGLAITQKIIESHGGTIKISSRLGEGTTFVVMLPLLSE
jgi:signal transduction histidine kinase